MTVIISIHSFRGGTGKSNITANIASQLAMDGKRVAVFDTDIYSPGIHVPFGLDENSMGRTLNEYLRSECSIEEVAFSIGEHPGSDPGRLKLAGKTLWLVPASINGDEISRVLRDGYSVSRLNEGIQSLRKQLALDYMMIDTHPGLSEETLLSLAISDVIILVLRPDAQDFQGTAVTIDVARNLDVPRMVMVINKALLNRYKADQIRNEVESTYGEQVIGVLPLSEDMADLRSADIFSLCYPDHAWSKVIQEMAQALTAEG